MMSGERLSGEERWKEFSNSFKARSAAESSAAEQSRSLSVRISTARRSVADDVTKSLDYAKAAAAEAEVKKEVQAMVARAMRAVEARYDRKPSIFDPRKI